MPTFPDISAKLPAHVRRRLVSGEEAYAYVASGGGCGGAPTELLVTDSRVVVRGVDLQKQSGCGGGQQGQLDIPLAHVSSVSDTEIPSGCGKRQGIGIASGSARQGVTAGRAELDGALLILQALIRARMRR